MDMHRFSGTGAGALAVKSVAVYRFGDPNIHLSVFVERTAS